MSKLKCEYETERLHVYNWTSGDLPVAINEGLASFVAELLSPEVLKQLPPDWQGPYDLERAAQWIKDRDNECELLLLMGKQKRQLFGLLILYPSANTSEETIDIRIGYMLHENSWGQGIASELIRGLVEWASAENIGSIFGGVAVDNIASQRVLIKCGFEEQTPESASELLFVRRMS